jgi:hypothetical protein
MIWPLVMGIVVVAVLLVAGLHDADDADSAGAQRRARWQLLVFIGLVSFAAGAFQLLRANGLQQTAALFIGIPALLAMAAVFVKTNSAIGVACKSVTIGLLISMILLGEGMLCVLMSAPLFYMVAVGFGLLMNHRNRPPGKQNILSWIALCSLMPMSLEGVVPLTTIARNTVVSETRIVQAPAAAVSAALFEQPRFERALPSLLAKGFPRPISAIVDGDIVRVRMRGGEMRLNGMEPRTGTLILERVEARPGFVRWRATSDDSHMRHFLTWQSSEVEWHAIDAETTRVTWSIRYRRDLDPAWYFGPMERFAVRLAAGYLIDSVATP